MIAIMHYRSNHKGISIWLGGVKKQNILCLEKCLRGLLYLDFQSKRVKSLRLWMISERTARRQRVNLSAFAFFNLCQTHCGSLFSFL